MAGDEVGPVDVELGQEVEVHQVVDAACIAVLEKLFVEDSVFAEVLAEVQEDAVTVLFQIEFASADAICAVVDGE
jgi:hypothetical protein